MRPVQPPHVPAPGARPPAAPPAQDLLVLTPQPGQRPPGASAPRLPWSAILGGALVGFAPLALLLGLGAGLGVVAPVALGVAGLAWVVGAAFVALFAAGFTTARLSGVTGRRAGALYGVLSWAALVAFSAWLLVGGLAGCASFSDVSVVRPRLGPGAPEGVADVTVAPPVAPESLAATQREDAADQRGEQQGVSPGEVPAFAAVPPPSIPTLPPPATDHEPGALPPTPPPLPDEADARVATDAESAEEVAPDGGPPVQPGQQADLPPFAVAPGPTPPDRGGADEAPTGVPVQPPRPALDDAPPTSPAPSAVGEAAAEVQERAAEDVPAATAHAPAAGETQAGAQEGASRTGGADRAAIEASWRRLGLAWSLAALAGLAAAALGGAFGAPPRAGQKEEAAEGEAPRPEPPRVAAPPPPGRAPVEHAGRREPVFAGGPAPTGRDVRQAPERQGPGSPPPRRR